MLGFTPFKRHPNKFNYIRVITTPRRRPVNSAVPSCAASAPRMPTANTSPDSTSAPSAKPGCAAFERGGAGAYPCAEDGRGAVLVLLFIYLLYPKLADVFLRARTAPATETQQVGEEEFNPYAPIRVVPNDYEE